MKTGTFCLTLCIAAALKVFAVGSPYEASGWAVPRSAIDTHVEASLSDTGEQLASPSSDAVFVRRVYLDLCGTVPGRTEVNAFLEDQSPDKRIRLIDTLIGSDRYVEFFTLRWCDLLRVKSEYPVNLWPNAVQAYHRWVRTAVRENRRYDEFARELITASGSNFRAPPANFYRVAPTKEPRDLAEVVSFTFMGQSLEALGIDEADGLAGFFANLGFKSTQEWKEEIVYWKGTDSEEVEYRFPGGAQVRIPGGSDPRTALADWMTRESNAWFPRAAVNRLWYWLNGYGLYEDADDVSSPCLNEELIDYLSREFVESNFDLQHVLRLILMSRTYQQSSVVGQGGRSRSLFSAYQVRPLEAEVLADALSDLLGIRFNYTSPIPEPFTFIPSETRTIELADGSITSPFLEAFGRPSRDSGALDERSCESTPAQSLYLLNSEDMHRHLNMRAIRNLVGESVRNPREWVNAIYLSILSREPTEQERQKVVQLQRDLGQQGRRFYMDLAWALINSKEFQFKH